jgi:formiminoglutamase
MIQNLVQNTAASFLEPTTFETFQYGHSIIQYQGAAIDLKSIDIALLSWGNSEHYQGIRKALYPLSSNFDSKKIIDLGVVDQNLVPLVELIDLLLQQNVFPIIISEDNQAVEAQLKAYEQKADLLNVALFDSTVPYSLESKPLLINQLMKYHPHLLFHLNCIGAQSYLVNKQAVDFLEDKYFEVHRLGKIQSRLEEIEPMVRNADLTAFSLASIRAADAPAQVYKNPNGLLAAEACKIMRYITMSDQLSSLCIHSFDSKASDQAQTNHMIAQLIWFAVEGFFARTQELPLDKKELRAYVVDNNTLGVPISFYKSPKSDRWWFEIPKALHTKHQLLACSYRDYQIACEGDLPDRILNAINRLT